MADEKKEPWLNYLALGTVVLAVCATLATFKTGGYSTRSVLNQTLAANQWAYYQSKSIKSYLHELQREKLQVELRAMQGKGADAVAALYRDKIAEYDARIAKYEKEKGEIEREARRLEAARDDAQRHARIFGLAVIFLQIGILLSSISALMKKKALWGAALAVGSVGVVYFADGFLLFLP